jgi:hypothetical protein
MSVVACAEMFVQKCPDAKLLSVGLRMKRAILGRILKAGRIAGCQGRQ